MNIKRTNKAKAALKEMTAAIAQEIIRTCPKHRAGWDHIRDPEAAMLNHETHYTYLQVRLQKACFLERQRMLDVIEAIVNQIDYDLSSPTTNELAGSIATELNLGTIVENGKLKRGQSLNAKSG